MKTLLVIWYLATPSLGEPETGHPFGDMMPNLKGASVEQLVYLPTVVILGFFDNQAVCDKIAAREVAAHLSRLDPARLVKNVKYGCIPDPKP